MMSGRPTLTAAVITLNEERNIRGLFERLGWVDEIVLVDSESTDQTRRLARDLGALVVERAFDNFAKQRNHALELAHCDWVLAIDADERPSFALESEIRSRIASRDFNAYRVPIRSSVFGRPFRFSGTQDDCPVRLVRRGCARWIGDVHETVQVQGRVGRMRARLTHQTHPDLASFKARMERYTTLAARARLNTGLQPSWRGGWMAAPRELFRRLVWKQGLLDGPEGWAFCLLSGYSEWVLAHKHRELWRARRASTGSAGSVP